MTSEVSKTNRLETANSSSKQSAKSTSIESGSIVEIAPHLGVNSIPSTSLSSSDRFSIAVSWVSSTSSSSAVRVVVVVVAAVCRVVASGAASKIAATTSSDRDEAVLFNEDNLSDDVICSYPTPSLVARCRDCCCCCVVAVTTLPIFSVNFLVVDIKDAIFMMAVDIVACMAIEYDNMYRVAFARK